MTVRILTVVMLCASFVAAKPSTRPAERAKEVAGEPATPPATQPTTQPAAAKFPTPAELIQRMKEMQDQVDEMPQVAYFDLSEPILEKPAEFSFFGETDGMTLQSILDRMRQARDDKSIRAVLVTLGQGEFNLAQAQEIRDALVELRRAGKETFVYADSYDTAGYTVASGATNICMLGGGEIMIPGVGIETMFAKGLLDKIGVKADYVQIGEYKGADEQFTRTEPSVELHGELTKLIDSLYEQIVDGISLHRNLSRDAVRQMIDDTILMGQAARDRGFVDHLVEADGLRDLLSEELGDEINLLTDYGQPERDEIDFSSPFAFFSLLARRPEVSTEPAVALIYAQGVIVDGEGGEGLFGDGGVGSEDIRRAMRIAERDENVKAIVIRIDSPGGSALASEVMWQAVRRVAEDKPVIISIGNMAASGGYYLASAGDHIFADASAIVGSIGVVGGKFVMKDLYDKLGLTSQAFLRGRNADLFSSNQPFTDRQRRMVTNWMKQTYDQFTTRIMTTRTGKIKDIDQVARGRIFLADQAKELGMVDEIGGIEKAIDFAADWVDLERGSYEVRVLPAPKTLADLFGGGSEARLPLKTQIAEDSILRVLSPSLRKMLGQQIRVMQLLQDRPVMLVSPYMITVQ